MGNIILRGIRYNICLFYTNGYYVIQDSTLEFMSMARSFSTEALIFDAMLRGYIPETKTEKNDMKVFKRRTKYLTTKNHFNDPKKKK